MTEKHDWTNIDFTLSNKNLFTVKTIETTSQCKEISNARCDTIKITKLQDTTWVETPSKPKPDGSKEAGETSASPFLTKYTICLNFLAKFNSFQTSTSLLLRFVPPGLKPERRRIQNAYRNTYPLWRDFFGSFTNEFFRSCPQETYRSMTMSKFHNNTAKFKREKIIPI